MDEGIEIKLEKEEIVIKGTKEDLLELSSYITKVANSKLEKDHIHLGTETLIKNKSEIKELIIEKE